MYFFITALPWSLENWVRFCFSASFLMLGSMLVFICHYMHWQSRFKTRAVTAYCIAGILLLILLPDDRVFSIGITSIMAGFSGFYLFVLIVLLYALRRERSNQHAITCLVGIAANIALGLHDWANLSFHLNHAYLLQFGQPLIFLVMGRQLLKEYIAALHTSDQEHSHLKQQIHQHEQRLKASMEKKQATALLQEKERIMANIHDGLGSHLVSALSLAETSSPNDPLISQTISQALDELRIIIDSLDPDEHKLSQMLAAFRHRYDQRMEYLGITICWQFEQLDELDQVGSETALQLLRILQELMTNIIKHAHADKVTVWMGISDNISSQECWLSVADNGVGFDIGNSLGRGMGNLKHRAEAIGGIVTFTSQHQGTLAELVFPIR